MLIAVVSVLIPAHEIRARRDVDRAPDDPKSHDFGYEEVGRRASGGYNSGVGRRAVRIG